MHDANKISSIRKKETFSFCITRSDRRGHSPRLSIRRSVTTLIRFAEQILRLAGRQVTRRERGVKADRSATNAKVSHSELRILLCSAWGVTYQRTSVCFQAGWHLSIYKTVFMTYLPVGDNCRECLRVSLPVLAMADMQTDGFQRSIVACLYSARIPKEEAGSTWPGRNKTNKKFFDCFSLLFRARCIITGLENASFPAMALTAERRLETPRKAARSVDSQLFMLVKLAN